MSDQALNKGILPPNSLWTITALAFLAIKPLAVNAQSDSDSSSDISEKDPKDTIAAIALLALFGSMLIGWSIYLCINRTSRSALPATSKEEAKGEESDNPNGTKQAKKGASFTR